MILYLGSSSLIKLYAEEPYSDTLREWARVAEIVATCRIAYTEIISALDIRFRNGDLPRSDYDSIVGRLTLDWPKIVKVDFDDFDAGVLVKKYKLTRFGALHLSAAKLTSREGGRRPLSSKRNRSWGERISLFFSSVDQKLCGAASSEGLRVLSLP